MVRRKIPHAIPKEAFSIKDQAGEEIHVEIWDEYPDKGKRGSHRRALRSKLFDKMLQATDDHYLNSNSPQSREHWRKMIYGELPKSMLVREAQAVARRSSINVGRTTVYEVAGEIQRAMKAIDEALKQKNSVKPPTVQVHLKKNKQKI